MKKDFFFRHYESFLLKNISFTLATDFVHRKKMYSQLNVALKKGRENDSERIQNHFQQSQVVF
tara:strand:+ start:168 stop:356 length:189 start_codon:yes stop_codon:yes gene_type:complete